MIEDEVAWLNNFQPIDKSTSDLSTEQILLTGMSSDVYILVYHVCSVNICYLYI